MRDRIKNVDDTPADPTEAILDLLDQAKRMLNVAVLLLEQQRAAQDVPTGSEQTAGPLGPQECAHRTRIELTTMGDGPDRFMCRDCKTVFEWVQLEDGQVGGKWVQVGIGTDPDVLIPPGPDSPGETFGSDD